MSVRFSSKGWPNSYQTALHLSEANPEDADALVRLDGRFGHRIEADLQRLLRRAMSLVTRHQAAVLAVAEALLARRALSGVEVQALVQAYPPSAAPSDSISADAGGTADAVVSPDGDPEGFALPG